MPIQHDPEATEVHYLHKFINLAGARVLEIGCGNGRMTWRYAPATKRVIAVEADAESLSQAQSSCPPALRTKCCFVHGSAENLPVPKQSVDIALFAWSL
jgi:ubiquinone/menaquinone biosynthesis C-methylase UbiE